MESIDECVLGSSGWFSIKNLICGDLKGINWCREQDSCTVIGANIANSMVKVAATRIFKDPAQCLVEIIVNSLDSYNQLLGKPKTGRFGMGFFSLLYNLAGRPENYIIINTKCENSPEYRLEIREINSELKFKLLKVAEIFTNMSGTNVKMRHSLQPGSFLQYMDYFVDVNEKIVFTFKDAGEYIFQDLSKNYSEVGQASWDGGVLVTISDNIIEVHDRAMGIPLNVLLNSLLIPSVSTKTLALSREVQPYHNNSYFIPKLSAREDRNSYTESNYFAIIINHIHLVHLPIRDKVSIGIYLPSTVTVPVTRDDIIMDPQVQKEFWASLEIILNYIIEANVSPVYALENALQEYSTFTTNVDNRIFIRQCLDKIYQKLRLSGVLMVKSIDEPIYRVLFKNKVVAVNLIDSFEIERKLSESKLTDESEIPTGAPAIDKLTFPGKTIIKMPPEYKGKVSNGGSISYIFVPAKIHQKSNWEKEITYQYMAEILDQEDDYLEDFLQIVDGNSAEYRAINTRIYNRAKRIYMFMTDESPENFPKFLFPKRRKSINMYFSGEIAGFYQRFAKNKSLLDSLLNKYIQRLDQIQTNLSYGDVKSELEIKFTKCHQLFDITNDQLCFRYFDYLMSMPNHGQEILLNGIDFNEDFSIEKFYNQNFDLCERTDFKYLFFLNDFILHLINTVARVSEDSREEQTQNLQKFREILKFLNQNAETVIGKVVEIYNNYIQPITHYSILNIWNNPNHGDALAEMARWVYYVKDHDTQLPTVEFDFELSPLTFTTKQLINYVFVENKISLMEEDQRKISRQPLNLKLQTVEIATNSGTTKAFINAVITELVQNSLDAIRLSDAENTVEIQLTKNKRGQLQVTVKDLVGMELSNIVSLLIPFYSTKVASNLVTGEMGTGFFNIYRESSAVKIVTVKNHKKIQINSLPIRDHDLMVTDIIHSIYLSDSQEINGTSITFAINNQNFNDYVHQVSGVANYVDDAVKFMDINLIFNGVKIAPERKLLGEFPFNRLGAREDAIKIYATAQNFNSRSYLFTKGVPFIPLVDFILNDDRLRHMKEDTLRLINTGIIIDLPHGFYQPIQSRNKVQIAKENIPLLDNFMLFALFAAVVLAMDRYLNDETAQFMPPVNNFFSETKLNSVKPSVRQVGISSSPDSIFWNYPVNYKGESIQMSKIVNRYTLHHDGKPFQEFFPIDPAFTGLYETYYQLIVKFVSSKKHYSRTPKIMSVNADVPQHLMVTKMSSLFFSIVKNRADIMGINYPELTFTVDHKFSTDDHDLLAYHTVDEGGSHRIVILAHMLEKYYDSITKLFNGEADLSSPRGDSNRECDLNTNKFAINYLLFFRDPGQYRGGSASVLIHEFEHARRSINEGPDLQMHEDITIDGNIYDFNGGALWYFDRINSNIYTEFSEKLAQLREN